MHRMFEGSCADGCQSFWRLILSHAGYFSSRVTVEDRRYMLVLTNDCIRQDPRFIVNAKGRVIALNRWRNWNKVGCLAAWLRGCLAAWLLGNSMKTRSWTLDGENEARKLRCSIHKSLARHYHRSTAKCDSKSMEWCRYEINSETWNFGGSRSFFLLFVGTGGLHVCGLARRLRVHLFESNQAPIANVSPELA